MKAEIKTVHKTENTITLFYQALTDDFKDGWLGIFEVELVDRERYAAQQAALAGAEGLLAEIAAKYEGGYPHITHVIGQSAERIRDEIRELNKVNEEASNG